MACSFVYSAPSWLLALSSNQMMKIVLSRLNSRPTRAGARHLWICCKMLAVAAPKRTFWPVVNRMRDLEDCIQICWLAWINSLSIILIEQDRESQCERRIICKRCWRSGLSGSQALFTCDTLMRNRQVRWSTCMRPCETNTNQKSWIQHASCGEGSNVSHC